MNCIYCRTVDVRRFPRDHVVPLALGRFRKNLTLRCVCQNCNAFFGNELELFLARDSIEAVFRIRYGLSVGDGSRRIGATRLTVRVISSGDWYGARVVLTRDASGKNATVEPLPQVAFRKNGESNWIWFLERELNAKVIENYRTEAETVAVGQGSDRIMEKVAALGVHFKQLWPAEQFHALVEVQVDPILDEIIFRAVGKIALNFLAYIKGEDFALRADFDLIRDYVRRGVRPSNALVTVSKALEGADAVCGGADGHRLLIDWDARGSGIVCLISLFNHLTYRVVLCGYYSGIWHQLKTQYQFDLQNLTAARVCPRL